MDDLSSCRRARHDVAAHRLPSALSLSDAAGATAAFRAPGAFATMRGS